MIKRRSRLGQVWVETVIYTLIAFVMIGLVLSYAKPKIEQLQDNAILQQSIDMLKQIDSTILTMGGPGNQRVIGIGIKAGSFTIDGLNDKLVFQMQTQSIYSEPDKPINDGNVIILTQKKTGYNLVTLTIDYSSTYDLKFEGQDVNKTITSAPTSYDLSITNEGEASDGRTILNMSIS